MAVGAFQSVLTVGGYRNHVAFHQMIFCLMAVYTLKVITSHVNVYVFSGIEQTAVQIAMFYCIAAAAVKMAAAAVVAGGCAHALRHGHQIHAIGRQTGI